MEGAIMTDHQFDSIIEMVDMILEGCKDISEAREKLKKIRKNPQKSENSEKE